MSDGDSLANIMQRLDSFVEQRDWNQFHSIKNIVASVGIEAAELTETVQWTNPSVEDAKATVAPIVRNVKKAEMIRKRASATNLDALAKAEKTTVRTASAINMKNPSITGVGREPLVVGAAFALKEGQTSKLLDGSNGVYMIQVTKMERAPKLDNYQAAANRVEQQKLNVVSSKLFTALKEVAEIEDYRAKNQIQ